jgi:hypothetical protein
MTRLMSRYGYDYSLTPARPTGWRGVMTNTMVFATVMAVSVISGAVVTRELVAAPAPVVVVPQAAAVPSARPAMTRVLALAAPRIVNVPVATRDRVAQPVTVAAAPVAQQVPAAATVPPPAAAVVPPPPAPPVSDRDLTFAKGYAQRQAVARVAPPGKVIVEARAQLGRGAVKAKPKLARNTNTADDRRRVAAARTDTLGMFQRFDRPDQFDFTRHQALAFGGEQHLIRQTQTPQSQTPRPAAPYGNSPNGLFGGLF